MRFGLMITVLGLAGCPGGPTPPPTDDPNDRDGDGFTLAFDCNDNDEAINPDADDTVGDGVDNNCDEVDGVDADGDSFASTESGGTDCDDTANGINPDAVDIGWNEVDENCSGADRHDWVDLGVGRFVTCGTKTTGDFVCWGDDSTNMVSYAPTTAVTSVTGADGYLCGIRDGSVVCWGEDRNVHDFPDDPDQHIVSNVPIGSNFVQVRTNDAYACALTNLGEPLCWGTADNEVVAQTPTNLEFNDLAIGDTHAYGVLDIGGPINFSDWGVDILIDGDPIPSGPFRQLGSGAGHMCGILQDSTLKCWGGTNTHGQTSPANRKGPYTDLSVSENHACGILSASRLACWGRNNFGQILPPANLSAIDVEVGFSHGCALNGQGIMFCWGDNSARQTEVP